MAVTTLASGRFHASTLLRHSAVQAALDARLKGVAEAVYTFTGITTEHVVAELSNIAFSNMMDFLNIDPAGDPAVDLSGLTRDRAAVLAMVTVESYTDNRGEGARQVKRVRIKLHDKRAALMDLGKRLGMFRQPAKGAPAAADDPAEPRRPDRWSGLLN